LLAMRLGSSAVPVAIQTCMPQRPIRPPPSGARCRRKLRNPGIGWEICTDPPGGGTYRITVNRLTVRKQAGR